MLFLKDLTKLSGCFFARCALVGEEQQGNRIILL